MDFESLAQVSFNNMMEMIFEDYDYEDLKNHLFIRVEGKKAYGYYNGDKCLIASFAHEFAPIDRERIIDVWFDYDYLTPFTVQRDGKKRKQRSKQVRIGTSNPIAVYKLNPNYLEIYFADK